MKSKLTHWLLNGFLLALAIVAWSVFAMSRNQTPPVDALVQNNLSMQLPRDQSKLELWQDESDGNQSLVLPRFQWGKPMKIGDEEMHQFDLLMKLSLQLATAQKASESDSWDRWGEIRFSSKSSPEQSVVPMYRVAPDMMGFEWQGIRYQSTHPTSKDLQLAIEKRN